MKSFFYVLILLVFSQVNAQKIRPFIGISHYFDNDFDKGFSGINLGGEISIHTHFKPEIEISHLFGVIYDNIRDNIGNDTNIYTRKAGATSISFCPKICLGDSREDDYVISIQPKYNFSFVNASGSNLIVNPTNPLASVEKKDSYSETRHSIGMALGIDIGISNKNSSSISFLLYYQGIEMGQAVTKLNFGNQNFKTNDVLGIGFIYYLGNKNKD